MKQGVLVLNFNCSFATMAVTIVTGGELLLPVCFVILHFQKKKRKGAVCFRLMGQWFWMVSSAISHRKDPNSSELRLSLELSLTAQSNQSEGLACRVSSQ